MSFVINPVHKFVINWIEAQGLPTQIYDSYILYSLLIINFVGIVKSFKKSKKEKAAIENGVRQEDLQVKDRLQENNTTYKEIISDNLIEDKKTKYKVDLLDYVGAFSLKRNILDADFEPKIYEALKAFINTSAGAYVILPHVAFREVFNKELYLNDALYKMVISMHFDFGIYDKNLNPIFFIEVWGKDHFANEDVMRRDEFKQELLKRHSLKLIIIDASKSVSNDETAQMLIKKIKEEIPFRDNYRVYCPQCHSVMKIKMNSKTKEYFYGCTSYNSKTKAGCQKTCSISDVPPLYLGISIKERGQDTK